MIDKILDNLIMLAQHVCDATEVRQGEIIGTDLAYRIDSLEKYLNAIRNVKHIEG